MQAHYLLGVALREQAGGSQGAAAELEGAAGHLTRALEAAREKGDSIKGVWRRTPGERGQGVGPSSVHAPHPGCPALWCACSSEQLGP
jgi:hypothetical protein